MITLGIATQTIVRKAILDRWLENSEHNRVQGWGRGEPGVEAAVEEMVEQAKQNNLIGYFKAGDPFGWVWQEDQGNRTVRLSLFFKPGISENDVTEAIRLTVDRIYDVSDFYRIEIRVVRSNWMLKSVLARVGFHREGELWASRWVGKHPQNEISLVVTPPHWKNISRKEVA